MRPARPAPTTMILRPMMDERNEAEVRIDRDRCAKEIRENAELAVTKLNSHVKRNI